MYKKAYIILAALALVGCARPYVLGVSSTAKYVSGVYDVTDATMFGIGVAPNPVARLVIGYDHTIVRQLVTGDVYTTMVRIKEQQLMESK